MTTPIEHLFRNGERVSVGDVPPHVLSELRYRVVVDVHRGVSVYDRWAIYSLVLRDGPEESGAQESLARGGESA